MPVEVQLSRVKGSRLPANTVSVARPTRWGNPFVVGEGQVRFDGVSWGNPGEYNRRNPLGADLYLDRGLTAEEAVTLYRRGLEGSLADPDPYFDGLRAALAGLRGKNLACFCPLGSPCHRRVLLDLANRPSG